MKRVELRFSDDLHKRCVLIADEDGRSLNSWLTRVALAAVTESETNKFLCQLPDRGQSGILGYAVPEEKLHS